MRNFEDTIAAVAIALQAGVPVLLDGEPGVAKTAIITALLAQLCDETHTSIVALHEPPEYGGFPAPQPATETEPARVALLPNDWVVRLSRAKRGGLFLDELSNGPPATRSAAMRGVHEGVWGDTAVPNLAVAAAMNPPEIAESGYELSAPLANRFCHIDWQMPVGYWVEQLISGFPPPKAVRVPEDWQQKQSVRATTYVAAFAHARPTLMQALPANATERAKAWPSFRSWTNAKTLLAACLALGYGVEHPATILLLSGSIGPGAAHEFLTFCAELDLPNVEDVLRDPKSLKLPKRGDRAFAVLTGVVAAVLADNTADRWARAWEVLAVAVEADRADLAAGAARALARNRPKAVRELPKAVKAFVPLLQAAGLMGAQ